MEFEPWDPLDGEPPRPVDPQDVERVLAARGVAAPEGYAAFAAAHGGRRLRAARHGVVDTAGDLVGIRTILHFDGGTPVRSAADCWRHSADELGPHLVPIATTEHAALVCLDYRAGADPAVVTYDHEATPDDRVRRLTSSFRGLLDRLA